MVGERSETNTSTVYNPRMSTYSRFPRRKAAEAASLRIRQFFHPIQEVHQTLSESASPPVTSSLAPLPNEKHVHEYQGSILYIRHLLQSIESATVTEQKKKYLNKLLKHLICDPSILIYEPQFRQVVEGKLEDIEKQLRYHHLSFRSTQLLKRMKKMRQSILNNVSHSGIRMEMMQKMNEVTGLMITYQHWAKSDNLCDLVQTLRTLLQQLKLHPGYVQ